MSQEQQTFAVVGATGRQGGAVVRALLAAGATVRGLTRDPASGGGRALADAGADPVAADPADPASVRAAFNGVDAAYVMTTLAGDGEADQGRGLVDAARDAGVGRIVLGSVGGAERATGIPHFESKRVVEEHALAGGPPVTIVRPAFFFENLQPAVEEGEVVLRLPLPGDVRVQMVAADDIGRVAAAMLLDPGAVPGGSVEIAGDELSGEDAAAAFGASAGLPARFEALPLDILDDDMRAMFTWFAQAHPAYSADFEATKALAQRDGGPPPADVAAWLQRTGWSPA